MGNLTAKDSGEVLTQQSSVPYDALIDALKQAGIHDDYIKGDALADAQNVANALASHKKFKSEEKAAENVAPDQYNFAGPEDLVHPGGKQWNPNQDPDFVKGIGDLFREDGFSQEKADRYIKFYKEHSLRKQTAAHEQQQKIAEAHQAEMGKLGAGAGDRLMALDKGLDANYGEGAAEAFRSGGNARQVEILEDLLAHKLGAGRSAPTRGNNVPAKPDLSGLSGYEHVQRAFGHSKG